MAEAFHDHYHFRPYLQTYMPTLTGRGGLFIHNCSGRKPGQLSNLWLVPRKMRGCRCMLLVRKNSKKKGRKKKGKTNRKRKRKEKKERQWWSIFPQSAMTPQNHSDMKQKCLFVSAVDPGHYNEALAFSGRFP